ncbi:restriction endonuclease [Cohnella candidum]|uniref:Restriction endonuclease n=1 Tax=Cohnella candidum TaxID=2674991 RepID=A0A3G3K359_9BACL|nr:restriction endonuclease [Cohnella candidum]AYQ74898.1 restriction endonuclease [Cohnella candidum]
MQTFWWLLLIPIALGVISGLLKPTKKKKKKRVASSSKSKTKTVSKELLNHRRLKVCRTDEVILTSLLSDLNGPEFERLLALYFRDQGYEVREVGIGGNDGGVDLVIIDRRGEKTAVQAKCYSNHNLVPVQTVRELGTAKRNHDCILALLITTSDLTGPAKKEAEQYRVDYWHGGLIEDKLRRWGKWNPGKRKIFN